MGLEDVRGNLKVGFWREELGYGSVDAAVEISYSLEVTHGSCLLSSQVCNHSLHHNRKHI